VLIADGHRAAVGRGWVQRLLSKAKWQGPPLLLFLPPSGGEEIERKIGEDAGGAKLFMSGNNETGITKDDRGRLPYCGMNPGNDKQSRIERAGIHVS
jgi:hypothetical protein